MDILILLAKGFMIGLSVAAPVGPIGLLVINRSLTNGFRYGVATGLGAASADTVYGLVAALGMTAIADFLIAQKQLISLVGGVFLCYLAIKTFRQALPHAQKKIGPKRSVWHAYATSFFLCFTNPLTILSFIAIFAGVGFSVSAENEWIGLFLALGVLLGASTWHVCLSGVISLSHSKVSATHMKWINIFSGAILLGFGVYSLVNVLT